MPLYRFLRFIERHERIISVCAILIVSAVLAITATTSPYENAGPDGLKYERMGFDASNAKSILECDNFKHAYWSPAWIATIALIYRSLGPHHAYIRIFQVLVCTATSVLIYILTRRTAGARAAVFAPLFFLLSTLVFRYTAYYQYELLLGFLSLASGALLFSDKSDGNAANSAVSPRGWISAVKTIAAGFCIGVASLLSPRVLVLIPLFGACFYLRGRRGYLAKTLPVFTAGILVVIVPWTARNYACFGELIATTTNGGINLYIGNNPSATGGYYLPPENLRPPFEYYQSGKWYREAIRYIRSHPFRTVGRSLHKGVLFWNPHYGDQFLLLFAFAAGWIRIARERIKLRTPELLWICALPFLFTAVHMVFFVQPRYFLPAMPCIAVIAGIGAGGIECSGELHPAMCT